MLISIEFCIVIGVFLSFALYIPRAAQVRLTPLTATPGMQLTAQSSASDPPDDGFLAVELEGELIFATEVEAGEASLRTSPNPCRGMFEPSSSSWHEGGIPMRDSSTN